MIKHGLRALFGSVGARMRHLSDESLLALIDARSSHPHLDGCSSCATRQAELLCIIADLDVVHSEADAAFDEERLLHQRQHILRRIGRNNGPARVLPFPAAASASAAFHALGPTGRRWVAAAAIGGVMLGVFSGRMLTHRAGRLPQSITTEDARATIGVRPAAAPGAMVPADLRYVAGDEVLLDEVDAALANPHIVELTAIDAITPAAR